MFIDTYEERDVYLYDNGNRGWRRKAYLTGNKINSNIITEIQPLDKDKTTEYIYANYVKVITNQKKKKFSIGIFAFIIPMWHSYSYKEYIVFKGDLDKALGVYGYEAD